MEIPPRVYADTSVYGGIMDDEFRRASRMFFDHVRKGNFVLAVSEVVSKEIEPAPEPVQEYFDEILRYAEFLKVTPEALALQEAYLDAGIITPKSEDDALHVAIASTGSCTTIVSWNFRHIVHFQKIPKYNAVNVLKGYNPIAIHSPLELVYNTDA